MQREGGKNDLLSQRLKTNRSIKINLLQKLSWALQKLTKML